MREELLESLKPLGQLMLECQLETFKEILDCGRELAGSLADYFTLAPTAPVIFRTYRTFVHHRPVMLITEKFPEHHWPGTLR
jgi:chorismate-pyruvate lyase